jgi:hypothetical protein
VGLTTLAPRKTFTYTPASGGAKTISVTNNGALANPASLVYTPVAGLADGNPVSAWLDSSGNGNHGSQSGSARPIFKTNILNGKPIVRFTTAGLSGLNLTTPIGAGAPWTFFVVMKPAATGNALVSLASNATNGAHGPLLSGATLYYKDRDGIRYRVVNDTAFHIFTVQMSDCP